MLEWGLFGGAGFIGQHLAHSVLVGNPDDKVTLLDIRSPQEVGWKAPINIDSPGKRLSFHEVDVRDEKQVLSRSGKFDVIVNLAAIHREPGHRPEEYFLTNVTGARNICRLAERTNCREIIFTSSISVYGVHDRPVDENYAVTPRTPYGHSKYEAESNHKDWARRTHGRLSILRPGVVFGHGEDGNVTRLVREMLKRDRVVQVKPDQPKAGIYIEELLGIIHWLRNQPCPAGEFHLVNGVSHENLTFNAFGRALDEIHAFHHHPVTVPGSLLRLAASCMKPLSGLFPAGSKLHPQRMAKLTLANDVRPTRLTTMGYPFAWPLERALHDWLEKGL